MEKQFFIDRTNSIIGSQSACAEIKEAAQAWLDAIDTDNEKQAAENYIAELEEDVTSLEDLIELLKSEKGEQISGARVKPMLKKAEDAEMIGLQYCTCAACNAGGAILDNKARFLELAGEKQTL